MKTKVISLILAAALIVSGCTAWNGDITTPVTEPSADATEVTEPVPTETEATPPATEVTEPSTEVPTTEATEPVTEHVVEPTDPVTEPTQAVPSTETTEVPVITEPAVTEPPVTEPGVTEPPTEVTVAPTEPAVTEPVVTDPPTTEPVVTEPPTEPTVTEPAVTDPPATEPVVTEPPTEPTVTEPAVTDPPVTEPPVTIPPTEATTVPTKPPHVHEYVEKVVAPTCTKKGYTIHTCDCGDSFKDSETKALGHRFDSYVSNGDATCEQDGTKTAVCENGCGEKDTVKDSGSALGHSYSEKVVSPTCAEQGYTLHKCQVCGDSYKDSYTEAGEHEYVIIEEEAPLINYPGHIVYECKSCGDSYTEYTGMTEEEEEAFIREVEKATAYYINQFRMEQGDTEATILPGLTQVAQYRAVQLQRNFEHSLDDLEDAYAYYNYGRWVDMSKYGYESYYTADAKEAIAWTGVHGTADEIGLHIATILRNSKNHWAYLGSSDFPYLAVGISHDYNWYICTLQTRENYG